MRFRVLVYRHQGLLGLLVVLGLLLVAGLLVAPVLRASRLGQLIHLGADTARMSYGATAGTRGTDSSTPTAAPSVETIQPSTSGQPPVADSTAARASLPVRAAAVGHATIAPAAVVDAFNCARAEAGLPPYTVDAQLMHEAVEVAARIEAGGHGPQPGEGAWTLTGSLVLDTTTEATAPCVVGGLQLTDIPDLDRAARIGVAVVPLPEPALVRAVVVGR